VHAKKGEKKNPREVITRNPKRKIIRRKKNTSLKQKKENKGGGEPYTSRRPFQPFFFFSSPISISSPSDTFHSLIPTPRSFNSSSKKSTSHRRTSLCTTTSSSQKKKLGVSPSPSCCLPPQTKLNNSSQ